MDPHQRVKRTTKRERAFPAESPAPSPCGLSGSDSVLSHSVGYSLRRAQLSIYGAFSHFLGEFDIRPSEFSALVLVAHQPGISPSALGAALDIGKTNMVPLLDRLQTRGLLLRQAVLTDRRVIALHLSAGGATVVHRMEKLHQEMERAIRKRLGEARTRQLLELLHDFANPDTTHI